jgi:peptide/nickel transport system permease protein
MIGYLLRRVGGSLVLLFLVLTLTFFLIHLAPGDPANLLLDPKTPEPIREQLRHLWGLDQPLGHQYLTWLGAILRGDWGTSLNYQEPVTRILTRAFPNTLVLAAAAALVAFGLGIPLGLWAARRQNELPDHALRIVTFLLYSLPTFWLAVMAILLFSYVLPVLPAGQMHSVGADRLPTGHRALDLLYHLVLPATVLGASFAGAITRFVRNSVLETLDQDYLRTARAKGLSEHRVLGARAPQRAGTGGPAPGSATSRAAQRLAGDRGGVLLAGSRAHRLYRRPGSGLSADPGHHRAERHAGGARQPDGRPAPRGHRSEDS